jgi:hypothetical protein
LHSNSLTALQDKPYDSTQDELKATILEVVTTMKDLMRLNPLYKEHIQMFVQVHLHFFFSFEMLVVIDTCVKLLLTDMQLYYFSLVVAGRRCCGLNI